MNRLENLLVALFCLGAWTLAAQTAKVSGRIMTEAAAGIEDCTISITGGTIDTTFSVQEITNAQGEYVLDLPLGHSYTIRPVKDDSPTNGTTTYDIVLMIKHIWGIEPLSSPYDIIAADINSDGQVNLGDSTELRKLLLGIYTEFPNNSSWRFVRFDYVFPDPTNPFVPPFPEEAVTGILTGDIENVNFIGVKIGDLDGSAFAGEGPGFTSLYPLAATGHVRNDLNGNCLADAAEPPLAGWLVTAQGTAGTFYASTISTGRFFLYAPPGVYDLYLSPPNALWQSCTDTIFGVQLSDETLTTASFAVQAAYDCPAMEVDVSALFLRRCFSSTYNVSYCNKGTTEAENVQVALTLDPFLTMQASSIPWSAVDGNTYTFDVGGVGSGECGGFNVVVEVSCAAELGQTHCTTAHIYPDTLCGPVDPAWSGADLTVSGECVGDEVVFTIHNNGADMIEIADYVVLEDILIQMTGGGIQLEQGGTETITVPANGSTWRIEVEQAPFHPTNQLVSATVEGCGLNGEGSVSLGIVTLFPTNDPGHFEDEDCQENVGSFDPNDKQGLPRGTGAPHYIAQGAEIEYLIRFQNTGTDTAFNILVRDTLSPTLDLASLRPGSSSFPYTMQVTGEGIATFRFDNIMLPDSNVNEAASHGYVQFAIRPKTGLPDGTLIENSAAIFFDFNLPVITNRTWHTLGSQFLDVSRVTFQPGLALDVFPNPAGATVNFFLKTTRPTAGLLRLFDARGQLVRTQAFWHNAFELPLADLPAGLYYFRLDGADGKLLATGKLLAAGAK